VKPLEALGVTAAAPWLLCYWRGGGAAAATVEEDRWDVILRFFRSQEDKRSRSSSRARSQAGTGLAGSKAMVEGDPKPVTRRGQQADTGSCQEELEQAGGKVEVHVSRY